MIQIDSKNFEMPVSCGRCKFSAQRTMSLGSALRCAIIGEVGYSLDDPNDVLNQRHPNCPLHEVAADPDTVSRQDVITLVENIENRRLMGEIDLTYAPMLKGVKALPPSPSRPHDISNAKFSYPICGAEMEVTVDEWDEGCAV